MIKVSTLQTNGGPGRSLPHDPAIFNYPTRAFRARLANEINEPALLANEVNVRGNVVLDLNFQGGL